MGGSPNPGIKGSPTKTWLAIAIVTAFSLAILYGFWGFSYDDAFITYRYSENLLERGLLTFNPGAVTYGTSAPGYAALLAVLTYLSSPLGISIPGWGTILSIWGLWASVLVLGRLSQDDEERTFPAAWTVLAGGLLVGLPWNVEMLGCESFPAIGLVALGGYFLFRRRQEYLGGFLLASAALLRLDAGLACIAFGIGYWAYRKQKPWRLLLAGSAPILAYALWLKHYFGQLLPDTLAAKQAESLIATNHLTEAQWAWLVRTCGVGGATSLLMLALLGATLLFARYRLRCGFLTSTAAWLVIHELIYRLVGVPFAPWYHLQTVAAIVFLSAYGAHRVASFFLETTLTKPVNAIPALTLSIALLSPTVLHMGSWLSANWLRAPDPRWDVYHSVGKYLQDKTPEDSTVAAVEIGFLAYSSDREILDLMGLVSPDIVAARRNNRLPDMVIEKAPEYILDVTLFRPPTLSTILEHPEIQDCYQPIQNFTAPEYMGPVTLLQRRTISHCS